MDIETLISQAQKAGASDLHLEPGMPPALRSRGSLKTVGDPIPAKALLEMARQLIGEGLWPGFVERKSADLSRTISGVRCRINVFQTSRGVALALRLLASFQATMESLNLHPDFRKLALREHGLILVSGPTGSGKSSTLAAFIQEINLAASRHIITVESPIEYTFRPRRAYIRQREVGRDTPSFEQALLDALREDPDVLMVGEMRDPETIRLTLSASETGHLVLGTLHSATCIEALQRVVSAFPAETQNFVASQLADSLQAVICQRLVFRADLDMLVPECEVLMATHAVRNFIRNREFFKAVSSIETGAEHGMWSFPRYRSWLENRTKWSYPQSAEPLEAESAAPVEPLPRPEQPASPTTPVKPAPAGPPGQRIEIVPEETSFGKILRRTET